MGPPVLKDAERTIKTRNSTKPPVKKAKKVTIDRRQREEDKKELVFNYKNKGIISGLAGISRETDKEDWFDRALAYEKA